MAIVVRNAEAAAETFRRALGVEPMAFEDYRGTAKVAFLRAGDTLLELIEPLTGDGPWAAALRERGEGAHHFALEVIDLRAAVEALRASGIGFLDRRPSRGTGNTLSVFLDPSGTGGTLIELVQQIQAHGAS
ncbi:MAG TPA: VOC family protein [bacterium]|nr:VOC family protein [bacterium]